MAQWSIRRNRAKPGVSSGHRSRSNDEDSVRAPHQGQQSTRTAPTGRTHDCKRPLRCTPNDLLPGGGHPHMKRRAFITLLGGVAAWPLAARAQQRGMRRIGVLMTIAADDPESFARLAAFLHRLQELGWVDGRNMRMEYRWAPGGADVRRKVASELIALAPDVILANGSGGAEPLLQATRTLPIVFVLVPDPVAAGYIESLARPGGNATGFTSYDYDMGGKWLELLKQIAPRVMRVGVLRDIGQVAAVGQFSAIQSVAPSLGIEAIPVNVRDADGIESAISGFASAANRGLIV